MLGRHGIISTDVSRVTLAVLAGVLFYFVWMDVILYRRIQSLRPLPLVPQPVKNGTILSSSSLGGITSISASSSQPLDLYIHSTQHEPQDTSIFSPFVGLSMKLMMMDHVNHYIENPISLAITRTLHMETNILWLTPNMLSVFGLFLAVLAARCISWDGRCWHLTAVALMLGRGLMDALDGMVARERSGITQHLSLHNTSGYVVDAVCDTLGYTAFNIGCFLYLRHNVPKLYQALPVLYQGKDKTKKKSELVHSVSCTQWTSSRIFCVVNCFGLQLALSSLLWDRYWNAYHKLLEMPRHSEPQAIVQNEVLRSTLMWIVIWLWRLANAHALAHLFLGSILLNRMWEYLLFIRYLGFAGILMLFLFTEIHLRDVTVYINTVP